MFHLSSLTVAYILLILFFAIDRFLRFGSEAKSFKALASDRWSTKVLIISFALDILCLTFSHYFSALSSLSIMVDSALPLAGNLVMIAGLMIRITATLTLRESYTRTLKIRDTQRLVKNGIYRYIRHPGYLGLILLWTGAGLSSGNYLTFIFIFIFTFAAYLYRISSEERMLSGAFGKEYFDYRQNSWRLVPFIF